MASGETDLDKMLATLAPVADSERYLFITVPHGLEVADSRLRFVEEEGDTHIIRQEAAVAAGLCEPGQAVGPFRCITLGVHSSLQAVGLLAAVTRVLAAADISVNAVAGYYHDHLFVEERDTDRALALLRELAA